MNFNYFLWYLIIYMFFSSILGILAGALKAKKEENYSFANVIGGILTLMLLFALLIFT